MQRVKVVALKRWKGTLEGKAIDSAKVYVEIAMDSTRNGPDSFAAGIATEEIRLPASEDVRRMEHIPLPFFAELETQRVSNGKTARDVVTGIRPVVDQVKPVTLQPKAA